MIEDTQIGILKIPSKNKRNISAKTGIKIHMRRSKGIDRKWRLDCLKEMITLSLLVS